MYNSINYEELGLDLIMNTQKKAKKTDTDSLKSHSMNKLHKAFQILQNRVLSSSIAMENLDSFLEYFDHTSRDVIIMFEKQHLGKSS